MRVTSSLRVPAGESVEGEVDEAVEDGRGGRVGRGGLGEARGGRPQLDLSPLEGRIGGRVVGQHQVGEGLNTINISFGISMCDVN